MTIRCVRCLEVSKVEGANPLWKVRFGNDSSDARECKTRVIQFELFTEEPGQFMPNKCYQLNFEPV